MVLLNFKRALYIAAFSQGVLSATVKNICGKNLGEATEEVDEVSKQLKISSCEASNVYDYVVKGEEYFKDALEFNIDLNFSEEDCKKRCSAANQKLTNDFQNVENKDQIIESSNVLMELDFFSTCEEICHNASLDVQVLKREGIAKKVLNITRIEAKSELEKIAKRADKPCYPISQGKVKKTPSYPYGYGYYRYTQEAGSVPTALQYVNGCGPKNNAQVSQIVGHLPYAYEFTPACNSHDICVTCHQLARSGCDSKFKTNMKAICSTMFQIYSGDNFFVRARKTLQKASCNVWATLFADAVSLFGENAYQWSKL